MEDLLSDDQKALLEELAQQEVAEMKHLLLSLRVKKEFYETLRDISKARCEKLQYDSLLAQALSNSSKDGSTQNQNQEKDPQSGNVDKTPDTNSIERNGSGN